MEDNKKIDKRYDFVLFFDVQDGNQMVIQMPEIYRVLTRKLVWDWLLMYV